MRLALAELLHLSCGQYKIESESHWSPHVHCRFTGVTCRQARLVPDESNSEKKGSKAALSLLSGGTTRRRGHHTMLLVLPAAFLLLISDMLPWSDQAALSSTSRDMHQALRPFVCAHTSRLRSIVRNWSSRSPPPASQAVSWPVALQSAGCMDTDAAVFSFVIAVAPSFDCTYGLSVYP